MSLNPYHLRCEYLVDPLAVDVKVPRLSWQLESKKLNARQSAYRILVSDSLEKLASERGNLWDSGIVKTRKTHLVRYQGKKLKAGQRCFWKVKAWSGDGEEGEWSNAASWGVGMQSNTNWKGKWIHMPNYQHMPPVYLRKGFEIKKPIASAVLYATARGIYECEINGKRVGQDQFAPGWTDYHQRIPYQAYDVTTHFKKGGNAIGAILADGWYKGALGWFMQTASYGYKIMFLSNLVITYRDGRREVIATDSSWKCSLGPILESGFLRGESHDLRKELGAWSRATYRDHKWIGVSTEEVQAKPLLEAHPGNPVRRTQELKAVKCWESEKGSFIYDMGQNFAGRVRIRVKGEGGTMIRLRHGEMVDEKKCLYTENLRNATSTDMLILKDQREVVWEPKFTFHGFRYVEITGLKKPLPLKNIIGVVLGSDTRRVGDFESSSELVNQLYSNIVWTQRANFIEVPTDCPQRDERLGWTGDAQVYIQTAIWNMDVGAFFNKWLADLVDSQSEKGGFPNVVPRVILMEDSGSAWGDVGTICPWTYYMNYGDRDLLARMFQPMKKWVGYLDSHAKAGVLRKTREFSTFGDWLSHKADTPPEVLMTAFYAHSVNLVSKAAAALGRSEDQRKYAAKYRGICRAFCRAFVDARGKVKGHTQTGYLLALHFGLLPDESAEKKAVGHLVADIHKRKNHLSVGFVGVPYLLPVLSEHGHVDLAYTLLQKTTYPSWGYEIVNGATTIWERWNSWSKEDGFGNAQMNSFSHYAYGSVGEWFFSTIAGIRALSAGYDKIEIAPRPGGGLTHARASYESIHGRIESEWRKSSKGTSYRFVIPPNCQANIRLVVGSKKLIVDKKVDLSKLSIDEDSRDHVIPLGSGEYRFAVN